MSLPDHPEALAAELPDESRWVQTRSLLLSGDCLVRVGEASDSAVVLESDLSSGSVVGRADPELLRAALADVADDFELVVQISALDEARRTLPGWAVAEVVVHRLVDPYPGGDHAEPDVVVSAPPEPRWLEGMPADVREYAALAAATASQLVGRSVVAVCAAGDVTETLWDVGIDTLEDYRRRGYAAACFRALAAYMAARGQQPVWSAYADYPPSLELAAKLGFRPVDRLAVLSRGSART